MPGSFGAPAFSHCASRSRLRVASNDGALGSLTLLEGRRQEERVRVPEEGEVVLMAGPLFPLRLLVRYQSSVVLDAVSTLAVRVRVVRLSWDYGVAGTGTAHSTDWLPPEK